MLVRGVKAEYLQNSILKFDFQVNTKNVDVIDLRQQLDVNKYTCYKSGKNPSCIDLVITVSPMSFLNIVLVKAGIFNIHKMVITILKTAFVKLNPKE